MKENFHKGMGAAAAFLLVILLLLALGAQDAKAQGFFLNADHVVSLGESSLSHPCHDTDKVKVWGAIQVRTQTHVTPRGADVRLIINKQGFNIMNLSDSQVLQTMENANGRVSVAGAFPVQGTASGDLRIMERAGRGFTARIFLDVKVDTTGVTTVTFNRIELVC